MHDILPDRAALWRWMESTVIAVIQSYDYQEIRLPIVEKTELFARSIGEGTDIVSKEMYTFMDRNEESLTLRPEGTAGCLRAVLEHGLIHNQTRKFWYMGPMFRHERPQRGRQRQFHQIGLETFGFAGPDIDAELILLCARIWRELGLDQITLQINTLGTPASRSEYRKVLVDYFTTHKSKLDEDSLRRLDINPLRILDSKNPELQRLIAGAPDMHEYLDTDSARHFDNLKRLLDGAGVRYMINPRLVRGLDYYTKTVFEWTTDQLGAQGTVCAGGRYDGLVEQCGGKATPATGCALGLERLLELVQQQSEDGKDAAFAPHLYLVLDEACQQSGLELAETLRDALPGLRIHSHCGGGGFKAQFKKADKSGAMYALILGPDEQQSGTIGLKPLRAGGEQIALPLNALIDWLREQISTSKDLN